MKKDAQQLTLHIKEDSTPYRPRASHGQRKGGSSSATVRPPAFHVPDFADPVRPATCLEKDFPITAINSLAVNEGNAMKPVYQMSKWWARRRSSVFRATLLAAATQAPASNGRSSAKLVWDSYYANHQKSGAFRHLKVLDPFMGGGTTLVEGSRLGFQVYGQDLNPVAWFVVRNEMAGTPVTDVQAAFEALERRVKPELMPFYTTTCPRGHKGRWVDVQTEEQAEVDPLRLDPRERLRYRWEGPEIIYTFWAKHGPCTTTGCDHRTPVMRTPIVAQKRLTVEYIPLRCTSCGTAFDADLGDTRMAPGATHVVLTTERLFSALSMPFARELSTYNAGTREQKQARVSWLQAKASTEPGLHCPNCGEFTGQKVQGVLAAHASAARVGDIQKRQFGINTKKVTMHLLVSEEWLMGEPAHAGGQELGGYAGASATLSEAWYQKRLEGLELVEVRGFWDGAPADNNPLPPVILRPDGRPLLTGQGTALGQGRFACQGCGRPNRLVDSLRQATHTAPIAPYSLQCYCPDCEAEGWSYGGRYFKAPDLDDVIRLASAETEWERRRTTDLQGLWPMEVIPYTHETHIRRDLPGHGYSHWWKMFQPRQLLVHATLLRDILLETSEGDPAVREHLLGAFQQYLRNQNGFCFWNTQRDTVEPMLSNVDMHPVNAFVENNVFGPMGRGNWTACKEGVLEGLAWCESPWEPHLSRGSSGRDKISPEDPVRPAADIRCGSSTDLSCWQDNYFDLVITDPPFGNNVNYADLADFFHVWLRIPMRQWYAGRPEGEMWKPSASPRSLEAISNPAEHPDTRTPEERREGSKHPADEFYLNTMTACWAECCRVLKPGGIMAFTFHHSEHEPWIGLLESLFEAGFALLETFPIRSDETKGEGGAFGAKKIEYDILHVCRKRQETDGRVSWKQVRTWVREEVSRFREVLVQHHTDLSPDDLRVMLYGKALQFYSEHYGNVYHDGELFPVRRALSSIDQLIDEAEGMSERLPDGLDMMTEVYLSVFRDQQFMSRDDLHKRLRLRPVSIDDLEKAGWVSESNKIVSIIPISDRFRRFKSLRRDLLKTDLDQAHFLIGAAMSGSNVEIDVEMERESLKLKPSVDSILEWYSRNDREEEVRLAASLALRLMEAWRKRKAAAEQTAAARNKQIQVWDLDPNGGDQSCM